MAGVCFHGTLAGGLYIDYYDTNVGGGDVGDDVDDDDIVSLYYYSSNNVG